MKRTLFVLAALFALILLLSACGGQEQAEQQSAPTAAPAQAEQYPPTADGDSSETPSGETEEALPTEEPLPTETPEPAPTAVPAPTASPAPTAIPLVAGTYEGSDGSVLTVEEDGSCTYETELSGTVNGKAMSGRITFHGTVDGGEFSFTKVTYLGLDITSIAKSSGYEDASYWEEAAAIIYAGAVGE